MWDESARPFDPQAGGYMRVYNALAGKQNMVRADIVDAKRLSTKVPFAILPPDAARVALNPSLLQEGDDLLICVRTLPVGGVNTTSGRTVNRLAKFHVGDKRLSWFAAIADKGFTSKLGLEDVRLFRGPQGELRGIASFALDVSVGVPKADMVTFRIAGSADSPAVDDVRIVKSPRYERNWMPVLGFPSRFVYSVDPLVVLDLDAFDGSNLSGLPIGGKLRGGSPLIARGEQFLAVVHEVATAKSGSGSASVEYTHRFVTFDAVLKAVKAGPPFFFQKRGIEFCCGLAAVGDRVWIAYGVEDKRAFLAEVPEETLKEFLPT